MVYSIASVSLMLNPLHIIWLSADMESIASQQLCDICKLSCLFTLALCFHWGQNNCRSFNLPPEAVFSNYLIVFIPLLWILSSSSMSLLKSEPQLDVVLLLRRSIAWSGSTILVTSRLVLSL